MRRIAARSAPTAMRMPSSGVRRETEYDTNPYRPKVTKSTAIDAHVAAISV
jgi:hypothetical protein